MFPLVCLNSMQVWSWARLFIHSVFLIGLLVHNNWSITEPLLKYRCIWKCSDTSWWSLIEMFTPIWQPNSLLFTKNDQNQMAWWYIWYKFPSQKKKKSSFEMNLWVLYVWRKQLFFSEPSEWVSSFLWGVNWIKSFFLAFWQMFSSWNACPLKTDQLFSLLQFVFSLDIKRNC